MTDQTILQDPDSLPALQSRAQVQSLVALASRLVIGVVFVLSGVPKLIDPGQFYRQVMSFGLVDASIGTWVAYAVPILELGIAGCLFLGVFLGGAWATTVVLMAGFTLLHLRVVVLGQEIACGCFDPRGTQLISWWTVSRNAIYLLISLAGSATFWLRPWATQLALPLGQAEKKPPATPADTPATSLPTQPAAP